MIKEKTESKSLGTSKNKEEVKVVKPKVTQEKPVEAKQTQKKSNRGKKDPLLEAQIQELKQKIREMKNANYLLKIVVLCISD